jgi:hypothetical protein
MSDERTHVCPTWLHPIAPYHVSRGYIPILNWLALHRTFTLPITKTCLPFVGAPSPLKYELHRQCKAVGLLASENRR